MGNHVAVDADGRDPGGRGIRGVGIDRFRDERADLARGVCAFERRQVDEPDDGVEGPCLRRGLDGPGAEGCSSLFEADGVDAGEPFEVEPEALLGQITADHAQRALGWGQHLRLFGLGREALRRNIHHRILPAGMPTRTRSFDRRIDRCPL